MRLLRSAVPETPEELEKENSKLKRLVAELSLEKPLLRQAVKAVMPL